MVQLAFRNDMDPGRDEGACSLIFLCAAEPHPEQMNRAVTTDTETRNFLK
jgi:hypothetical protein